MGRKIKQKNKILKALKNVFLDIVSFGSPQARVFNLTSILLILRITPTSKLSYSPFKCVFKNFILPLVYKGNCPTTGIFANCECPGCGLTRAMSRLLHGDLGGALAFNKLVIPVFIVMITLIIINIIKTIKKYKKTKKLYNFKYD